MRIDKSAGFDFDAVGGNTGKSAIGDKDPDGFAVDSTQAIDAWVKFEFYASELVENAVVGRGLFEISADLSLFDESQLPADPCVVEDVFGVGIEQCFDGNADGRHVGGAGLAFDADDVSVGTDKVGIDVGRIIHFRFRGLNRGREQARAE